MAVLGGSLKSSKRPSRSDPRHLKGIQISKRQLEGISLYPGTPSCIRTVADHNGFAIIISHLHIVDIIHVADMDECSDNYVDDEYFDNHECDDDTDDDTDDDIDDDTDDDTDDDNDDEAI